MTATREIAGSPQSTALSAALSAAVAPTSMSRSDSCRAANESYRDFQASWKRLNNLVYALALAATVFLIGGIVLAALGSDTRAAGIVSFVGTAVTGLGARFVLRERNQAARDKLGAAKLVREYCERPESKLDTRDLRAITAA